MYSLLLPAAYLGGCILTMSVFSHFYRKMTGSMAIEPWFPENIEGEKYMALVTSVQDDDSNDHVVPKVPEKHLHTALTRWAMEIVRRLVQIQQDKPVLQQLLRAGQIGDDLWRDFTIAEQEVMAEAQAIAMEAKKYKQGWEQAIFSQAAGLVEHEKKQELKQKADVRLEKEKRRKEAEEKKRGIEAKKAEQELLKMDEEEKRNGKGKKK